MNRRIKTILVVAFAASWMLFSAPAIPAADGNVGSLIEALPARDAAAGNEINAEMVKLGPTGVRDICSLLVPPGTGDDTKARYALSELAKYVSRAGADMEREMVSGVLIGVLSSATDVEVKAFLIRLLQLAGKEEAVAPLARFLTNEKLCEPATQALFAIGTAEAADALFEALPSAKVSTQATIVKALGDLQHRPAAKALLPFTDSDDPDLRCAALYAIASIGDRSAQSVLAEAAQSTSTFQRAKATSYYLLYARRQAERGKRSSCEKICRELLENRTDAEEANVRSAALSTLVSVRGARSLKYLLAAMDDDSTELRGAALQLADTISGESATNKWVRKLAKASPEVRVEILFMLARRGDGSALPAMLEALNDPEQTVRLAAISAATRLGGTEALPALLARLQSMNEAKEIEATKRALLLLPGRETTAAVADSMDSMPARSRVALLEVLSIRRATPHLETIFSQVKDEDASVRIAAISALSNAAEPEHLPRLIGLLLTARSDREYDEAQKTVVSVTGQIEDADRRGDALVIELGKVDSEQKSLLLATLARIGGEDALHAVVANTKHADNAVLTAAVRALADWPNASAARELLLVIRDSEDRRIQGLALRGYIRIITAAPMDAEEKVARFRAAMTETQRPDDRKLVLDGLAEVRHTDALKLAAEFLDHKALRDHAASTIVTIACPTNEDDQGLHGPKTYAILQRAAKATGNAGVRDVVEKHLQGLGKRDADGFSPLFNGKDLTGWVGSINGYRVDAGKIVCIPDKGGNLFTQEEFGNFVLRFEFKLPPDGANNGLGIRAPLGGDAAYSGMEIQILDHNHPMYKDIKPWQAHGSVYGVVAAKRGHLKPIGEWNSEEVIAKGKQITVILNGATIVDADIAKASTPKTLDGHSHPGLKRTTGHIGFLGHGHQVEFRNIRIKELPD